MKPSSHACEAESRKLRLCAALVMEAARDGADVNLRVDELAVLGAGWNPVVALQYLAGSRARACIDRQPAEDQAVLLMAHLIAKSVCSDSGILANMVPPDGLDRAAFEAACTDGRNSEAGRLWIEYLRGTKGFQCLSLRGAQQLLSNMGLGTHRQPSS